MLTQLRKHLKHSEGSPRAPEDCTCLWERLRTSVEDPCPIPGLFSPSPSHSGGGWPSRAGSQSVLCGIWHVQVRAYVWVCRHGCSGALCVHAWEDKHSYKYPGENLLSVLMRGRSGLLDFHLVAN